MRKADIAAAVGLSTFGLSSPAQVIATKFVDGDAPKGTEMQRPLCPYPQRARSKGEGDASAAASFACAVDKN